ALLAMARGVTRYLCGGWTDASEHCQRAEEIFRASCQGVAWELDTAQAFRLYGWPFAGKLAALTQACPAVMKEAEERGDRFAAAHLGTFIQPLLLLAADRPDDSREELNDRLAIW